jgi:replicative DNA helicase
LPIIVIAQLNRQPDTRAKEGPRPRLSDLRKSGSIEQDADLVGLLVRPEYYETDDEALLRRSCPHPRCDALFRLSEKIFREVLSVPILDCVRPEEVREIRIVSEEISAAITTVLMILAFAHKSLFVNAKQQYK